MTETAFERDIAAQPEALRGALAYYAAGGIALLDAARGHATAATRVLLVGMGSSLSAAVPAADRMARHRPAFACEAGELLHYGLADVSDDSLVVLVSQSGRSVETLAVGEQLQRRGHRRLIAVTNDTASPLAAVCSLTLPILAGEEATVSTKTFVTTFVVLHALVGALAPEGDTAGSGSRFPPGLADAMAVAVEQESAPVAVAEAMRDCVSVSLIARGPSVAAADYGALIMKETVAMPCEAFSGGSFRHGPLETAGPRVGIVVLAPGGRTQHLGTRLARETSQLGSPTWLIGDDAAELPPETDRLRVMTLPAVDEAFAPLLSSVPIQRLAAALARQRGRVPGILLRSSKVTETE
jgi:glucosamine--fructose-6-phosphate aminotransferase (isomerizing)